MAPDPTGIYVHLPFCRVKCSYCAFAVSTDLRLEQAYGEALIREIETRALRGTPADTLFWGGGTPGLLEGNGGQVLVQVWGVVATIAWCAIATFVLLKIIDALMGLRVSKETEIDGLDLNLHGEVVP